MSDTTEPTTTPAPDPAPAPTPDPAPPAPTPDPPAHDGPSREEFGTLQGLVQTLAETVNKLVPGTVDEKPVKVPWTHRKF